MSTSWFYVKKSEKIGPVSDSDFLKLKMRGDINPNTYVWKKGFKNWLRLKDVNSGDLEYPPIKIEQNQYLFFSNLTYEVYGPFDKSKLIRLVQMKRVSIGNLVYSLDEKKWKEIESINDQDDEISFRPVDFVNSVNLPELEFCLIQDKSSLSGLYHGVSFLKENQNGEFDKEVLLLYSNPQINKELVLIDQDKNKVDVIKVKHDENKIFIKKVA